MTLAQARRRTGLVGVMRMGFTVGAAVSAGVMLGYLIAHALVSLNEVAPPPARGVTMLNPRFNGRDANDQPFIITAATAKQRRGEKQKGVRSHKCLCPAMIYARFLYLASHLSFWSFLGVLYALLGN